MAKVTFAQKGVVGLSKLLDTGSNGRLLHIDPTTGKRRQIRHCPNEGSPYIDEQSDFALVEAVSLKKGSLVLDDIKDKTTVEFLRLSPQNVVNGGSTFGEVDEEEEAVSGLFLQDLVVDLKAEAKAAEKSEGGHLKLLALASVIKGNYNLVKDLPTARLRSIVYGDIDEKPMLYYNKETKEPVLFSPDMVRSFMSIRAVDSDEIEISPDQRTIKWPGGDVIVDVPAGRKAKDFFTEFLATPDGEMVAKRLEKVL
jgi:hypothetical protein